MKHNINYVRMVRQPGGNCNAVEAARTRAPQEHQNTPTQPQNNSTYSEQDSGHGKKSVDETRTDVTKKAKMTNHENEESEEETYELSYEYDP